MYEDSIVENERLNLGLPTNDEIQLCAKRKNAELNTRNKKKKSKKNYESQEKIDKRSKEKYASQDEMANRIIDFFNDNKAVEGEEVEDFQNFEVTYDIEESNRKILLKSLLDKMTGKASISLYRTVIELLLLRDKYNINYDIDDNDDEEDNDEDDDSYDYDESSKGEKRLLKELKSVITSTLRASSVLKISKRFCFIVSKCKKNGWENCKVPPSFWRFISNDSWENKIVNKIG
ncbi:unnamed protein product [Rhizophagus irregularis]|nr:unnamed protein product [Rhizophagus irregularis]